MSVGKLCDAGYDVTFNKHEAIVYDNDGTIVLLGWRDDTNGLWRVPLTDKNYQISKEKREQLNNVYQIPSIENAIKILHAALGFPVKSTWLKAVKLGGPAQ